MKFIIGFILIIENIEFLIRHNRNMSMYDFKVDI